MLVTPHQLALNCDHLEPLAKSVSPTSVRWTWIAGRRYRGVRRL